MNVKFAAGLAAMVLVMVSMIFDGDNALTQTSATQTDQVASGASDEVGSASPDEEQSVEIELSAVQEMLDDPGTGTGAVVPGESAGEDVTGQEEPQPVSVGQVVAAPRKGAVTDAVRVE